MFADKWKRFKRGYVSEIDQFLQEITNIPGAKCNARIEEEQKYQRIFALRDIAQPAQPLELPWKDF